MSTAGAADLAPSDVQAPASAPPLAWGMTVQARWAWGIVVGCAGGLVALALWHPEPFTFGRFLEVVVGHGFEGALVGVLCDKKALHKLYRTARSEFDALVTEISHVVIRDMVKVKSLLGSPAETVRQGANTPAVRRAIVEWLERGAPAKPQLDAQLQALWTDRLRGPVTDWLASLDLRRALLGASARSGLLGRREVRYAAEVCIRGALESPERAREVRTLLCRTGRSITMARFLGLHSREDARKLAHALYDQHAESLVIDWLATTDLREALRAQDDSGGLLREEAIRKVIAQGVRHATADEERTSRLHAAVLEGWGRTVIADLGITKVTVEKVAGWFLKPAKLHVLMSGFADTIESAPTPEGVHLQALLQEYVVAYLDGWHDMDATERRAAAERIHAFVMPRVIESVADTAYLAMSGRSLEEVLQAVVSEEELLRRLRGLADWLSAPPQEAGGESGWGDAMAAYAGAWLGSWHALDERVRKPAAEALVDLAGGWLVDAASDWLWAQRESLASAESLSDLPWVRGLLEAAESLVVVPADIDARVATLMADRLRSGGADEFVEMLEEKTRPQLDSIQLNGGAFGFLIGGGVGLALFAAELLRGA